MTWLPFVNPFFLVFWALPPVLIYLGFKRGKRIPLWASFLAYILVGWLCVNAGIWLYYKSLGWLIHATDNPPQEWTDAWVADGAKRVFGLLFGWIYAILYFILWFTPAWLIKSVLHIVRNRRPSNKPTGAYG